MNPFSHLDESGQAKMVDVGAKPSIGRRAVARGVIYCARSTIALLRDRALPKGDVLAVARLAGIQAAKRTDELIPLCHSLPLDGVAVDFSILADHIEITAQAKTTSKTGVEMEALTAVSVAALTLYDMMKAVDKGMRIDGICVVEKEKDGIPTAGVGAPGLKNSISSEFATAIRVGRVTLSDRASAGVYQDLSGPEIERVFSGCWGAPCEFVARLLSDERAMIAQALADLCDSEHCELVITTGGTGPAARDVTPEATREVIEKEMVGLGEAMRAVSFPRVPTAILSRALAGIRGQSLILNLPGNPKAIAECLPPLIPAIRECLRHLRGA